LDPVMGTTSIVVALKGPWVDCAINKFEVTMQMHESTKFFILVDL